MSARTIYMIGGTTEANLAAGRLQEDGYRVIVSVATPLGERVASAVGLESDFGFKNAEGMAESARAQKAAAIIDCSHPFAIEASREASEAANRLGLPYLRFMRLPFAVGGDAAGSAEAGTTGTAGSGMTTVQSFEDAAGLLAGRKKRALLTIGTRNLEFFTEAQTDFTARILPTEESFKDCARLGIKPQSIIAAWPPFSEGFNRACLRKCEAEALVTKDSGREGGLMEKLQAAAAENAEVILITMPIETGAIHDLEILSARLREVIAS